jgi:hypothetical protein
MIGVSVGTLRNWEQGRRKPEGPALALLRVASAEPKAVTRALRGAASVQQCVAADGARPDWSPAAERSVRRPSGSGWAGEAACGIGRSAR